MNDDTFDVIAIPPPHRGHQRRGRVTINADLVTEDTRGAVHVAVAS
jgi:hypothetical protein